MKKTCAEERASNIDLTGVRQLQGIYKDQSGASFTANYVVEIRDPATGHVLRNSPLDTKGHFSFEGLTYDRINLILVLMDQGKSKRTGFETPSNLQCNKSENCKLEIVLKAGSTDQAKDLCRLN